MNEQIVQIIKSSEAYKLQLAEMPGNIQFAWFWLAIGCTMLAGAAIGFFCVWRNSKRPSSCNDKWDYETPSLVGIGSGAAVVLGVLTVASNYANLLNYWHNPELVAVRAVWAKLGI